MQKHFFVGLAFFSGGQSGTLSLKRGEGVPHNSAKFSTSQNILEILNCLKIHWKTFRNFLAQDMLYMTGGPIRCPRSEPREEKTAFVILTLQPISLSPLRAYLFFDLFELVLFHRKMV